MTRILCILYTLTMVACSSFHYVKTGDPKAPIEQIVDAGESEDVELANGLRKLLQKRIDSPSMFSSEKTIETIIALGKLAPDFSTAQLVQLLRDPSNEVRFYAVEALGDVRDSSVVQALISSTKDEDELVAEAASRALSKLTLIPIYDEIEDTTGTWQEWWQENSKYFVKK